MESTRRERKKETTRSRILEAAMDLFGRRGFEQTTMDEIAEVADFARATVFNHFPSKENLLVAYHARLLEDQLGWMHDLREAGKGARAYFEEHFARGAAVAEEEGERFRVLVKNLLSNPVVMAAEQERAAEIVAEYRAVLEEAVATGELRADLDVEAAVRLVAGVWSLSVIEWAYAPGPLPLAEAAHRKLDALFRGLAARD